MELCTLWAPTVVAPMHRLNRSVFLPFSNKYSCIKLTDRHDNIACKMAQAREENTAGGQLKMKKEIRGKWSKKISKHGRPRCSAWNVKNVKLVLRV